MKELSVKLTRRELIGGWIYFCIQLVALPFLIVLINAIFGNPMSEAICNIIFFFVNFIVVAILFRKYLRILLLLLLQQMQFLHHHQQL